MKHLDKAITLPQLQRVLETKTLAVQGDDIEPLMDIIAEHADITVLNEPEETP